MSERGGTDKQRLWNWMMNFQIDSDRGKIHIQSLCMSDPLWLWSGLPLKNVPTCGAGQLPLIFTMKNVIFVFPYFFISRIVKMNPPFVRLCYQCWSSYKYFLYSDLSFVLIWLLVIFGRSTQFRKKVKTRKSILYWSHNHLWLINKHTWKRP